MIQGEKYELKEVRPETGKKSDDNFRFSAVFSTSGFAVEKRNNRKNVTVVLMVNILRFNIKIYLFELIFTFIQSCTLVH